MPCLPFMISSARLHTSLHYKLHYSDNLCSCYWNELHLQLLGLELCWSLVLGAKATPSAKPHVTRCLKSLSLLHSFCTALSLKLHSWLSALCPVTQAVAAFPRASGAALSPCSHATDLALLSSLPCTCRPDSTVTGGSHGKWLPPAWESPLLPLPLPTLWSKLLVDISWPKKHACPKLNSQSVCSLSKTCFQQHQQPHRQEQLVRRQSWWKLGWHCRKTITGRTMNHCTWAESQRMMPAWNTPHCSSSILHTSFNTQLFTGLLVLGFCNLHCYFFLLSFFGSSSVNNFLNSCSIIPFLFREMLLLASLKKMKSSLKLAYTVLTWRLRGQILCKGGAITI